MDNKIEVFKNEQFGEIRTALIENEPWFVAVDVCRALEIGNSSQAISRLDADEKMITLISNEGNKRGNPNMTVVNEPGLYTLILTEEVIVETRYRTETDTWTDVDGNTHTETYRVPYDYYICNVKLENFNLSHVPVYIMSQEQLSMYATYMSVLGNREDLFGDSPYVDKYITNPPADYDVNPEYLNDEKFATLITEAEKYLGYPYVWGGSNPDTSFDCSGFVSYVLTNSGLVNTGRLGAQGLYNVCTPVSKANAQPGDLIFFVGTYDTPGVSHVGIYVGDGVMIHCGDPIQYTSINSSYWQQHFYAFGRPAY